MPSQSAPCLYRRTLPGSGDIVLTTIVGKEHGHVLRKRYMSPESARADVRQMKVKRNVVEPPRGRLADVQDDAGGHHRVDSVLNSIIDGEEGTPPVEPGTYGVAIARYACC